MKTFPRPAAQLLLLAALAGASLSASAQSEPAAPQPVGVERVGEFVYLVRVSNPQRQPGRLQLLRPADGSVLYEDSSSQASFGQKLNVQHLPDGEYQLVVKLGPAQHRFTLNLRTTTQRTTDLTTARR
ncbi:hypothetical protein [Hymenobacter sp. B81]|uniref:hypothetical protein n=1 Tax=Hymenobacter sp. B81 TaxID=3344878 RepID=UPI0037DCA358